MKYLVTFYLSYCNAYRQERLVGVFDNRADAAKAGNAVLRDLYSRYPIRPFPDGTPRTAKDWLSERDGPGWRNLSSVSEMYTPLIAPFGYNVSIEKLPIVDLNKDIPDWLQYIEQEKARERDLYED